LQVAHNGPVSQTFAPRPLVDADHTQTDHRGELPAIKETQHGVRADGDMQVLRQSGAGLTAQENTDSGQQVFQPFGATRMGTDQSRETFCKHAAATGRILAPKPSHHQLNVHRPAVRGQVHQEPGIAAVPAAGDAAARRTWDVGLCTLDGDGNVCWRKLRMPNGQSDASKKSPHTAKPHAKQSQRGSRLSRKFLQSAAGLHQKCGRASLSPPMTKLLMPNGQSDASKKYPHTAKPHAQQSQSNTRLSERFLQPTARLHQKCGRTHFVPALTTVKAVAKYTVMTHIDDVIVEAEPYNRGLPVGLLALTECPLGQGHVHLLPIVSMLAPN